MKGVLLTLEVPAGQAGDRLTGTLHLENGGHDSVRAASPLNAAALNVVVFDRYWNAVQPQPQGKANVGYDEVTLDPGEAVQFALVGLAFTSGTARFAYRLQPGRHFAVAVYHPGTSRRPEDSSFPHAMTSNVVPFDVEDGVG